MAAFKVCGLEVAPGEMQRRWVKLAEVWNGPFCIPLIVAHGRQPGKTLYVQAMQHGDEYDGFEAALRLADLLDPAEMSGTVLIVPCLNIPAFVSRERFSCIDGHDMNRVWPGREQGFFTEQIVDFVHREILPRTDYAIDLHGGTLHLTILPYVSWSDAPEESAMPLLKAAGIRDVHIWQQERVDTWLAGAAAKLGIPCVYFETGGGARVDEEGVRSMVRGITNIAKHLGILPGRPEGLPQSYRFLDCRMIHARAGGYLFPAVGLGDPVREGDPLGTIVNLLGEEVETVRAPFDGYAVEVGTLPKVSPGDWVFMVGSLVREEPAE